MTDRIPGAPGRYNANLPDGELQKLQNGEPFAITLTRDDDPIVEGTPYSKAAVLPDELATKLCPNLADPAPKDALAALYQIADQGTSGGWAYRKWNDGVAECWRLMVLDYEGTRVLRKSTALPFPMNGMVVSMTVIAAERDYTYHKPYVLSYNTVTSDSTVRFVLIDNDGGMKATDYITVAVHITGNWE